jgi:hypothetical protein
MLACGGRTGERRYAPAEGPRGWSWAVRSGGGRGGGRRGCGAGAYAGTAGVRRRGGPAAASRSPGGPGRGRTDEGEGSAGAGVAAGRRAFSGPGRGGGAGCVSAHTGPVRRGSVPLPRGPGMRTAAGAPSSGGGSPRGPVPRRRPRPRYVRLAGRGAGPPDLVPEPARRCPRGRPCGGRRSWGTAGGPGRKGRRVTGYCGTWNSLERCGPGPGSRGRRPRTAPCAGPQADRASYGEQLSNAFLGLKPRSGLQPPSRHG